MRTGSGWRGPWSGRRAGERGAGLVTAWAEAHHTGRNRVVVDLVGTSAMRGSRLVIGRDVASARAWVETRHAVSMWLLRDVGGLTAQEAHRASTVALVLWSRATAMGINEINWNVALLGCDPGTSASCFRMNLSPVPTLNTFRSYSGLVAAVRDFWNRPHDWSAFKRGDLSAIAGLNATAIYPMSAAELGAQRTQVEALVPPYVAPRPTPGGGGGGGSGTHTPGGATPQPTPEGGDTPDPGGGDGGADPVEPVEPVTRRKKSGVVAVVGALFGAVLLLGRR